MTNTFSFDVLSDGSLILTVGESCIQTAAKRAHREVTAALLEGRAKATALGALADMLERFLGTTDFSALRTEHPELAGGTPCRVRLRRRENGSVGWSVVDSR
jgi:hypothetical protein